MTYGGVRPKALGSHTHTHPLHTGTHANTHTLTHPVTQSPLSRHRHPVHPFFRNQMKSKQQIETTAHTDTGDKEAADTGTEARIRRKEKKQTLSAKRSRKRACWSLCHKYLNHESLPHTILFHQNTKDACERRSD